MSFTLRWVKVVFKRAWDKKDPDSSERIKAHPCDNCGFKLQGIPEKCPQCGELIRSRMHPEILKKIESIYAREKLARLKGWILVGFSIVFLLVLIVSMHVIFVIENGNNDTTALVFIIFLPVFLCTPFFYKGYYRLLRLRRKVVEIPISLVVSIVIICALSFLLNVGFYMLMVNYGVRGYNFP